MTACTLPYKLSASIVAWVNDEDTSHVILQQLDSLAGQLLLLTGYMTAWGDQRGIHPYYYKERQRFWTKQYLLLPLIVNCKSVNYKNMIRKRILLTDVCPALCP